MMNDDLKEFTEKYRERFELGAPDLQDIWAGIEIRLDKADRKIIVFPWKTMMKIAASISLIAVIAIGYYANTQRIKMQNSGIALHNVSSELAETEAFYSAEIQDRLHLLEVAQGALDPGVLEQLEQMDNDYRELKNDLQDHADSEEVINAMIGYYRLKLELLEKILDEIQENNEDETNDETRSI